MPSERPLRPGRCGILAGGAAAVLAFAALVLPYWHPVYGFTAFLQLDHSYDATKIAAFREYPVYVHPEAGPYDGIAYSQIAYHPLLRSPELVRAVDNPAYRARRILPSALAWLLAAGRPALIVRIYSELNLAAWLVLAALLWRLLPVGDGRTLLVWIGILFSAGALASVRFALTDLVALVPLAAGMALLERGRGGKAAGCLALAALTRETSLLAVPGFWVRPARTAALRALAAALPLALWLAYIRWAVGPTNAGSGNFGWPGAGFAAKWLETLRMIRGESSGNPLLDAASAAALAGMTAQAAFLLLRPRFADAWWRIGASYLALLLVLGPAVWAGYPGAAARVLLPMTLAFNVLAGRRRAALAWILAGNLGIVAGVASFCDPPPHPRQLAAVRADGGAWIVRTGSGWYETERSWHGDRAWCRGDGRLEIQSWGADRRTVWLAFELRTIRPRTVALRQGGRELWRGTLGSTWTRVEIPVETGSRSDPVDFSTDAPPVSGPTAADSRQLAFALRGLHLRTIP
ncbi:MAG TPA: hypothetical protein VHV47_06820 [Opitutaceae bacterium]|jgi:hypothetical protein|nr:hypothetical protein [Opitutaceae bacterium]